MDNEDTFYEGLRMLEYFWTDKGDVTRWSGFEEFMPKLKERRPDVYLIIKNYTEAEQAMHSAMRNL